MPTDTLLHALRVMEAHQLRLLGVVGPRGALLGLVSEEHLLGAWREDPLLPVCAVMALCARPPRLRLGWSRRPPGLARARGRALHG